MRTDFTVKGREDFLSQVYFDTHFKFELNEVEFARRTLLQRIIWSFKPSQTSCSLDNYDADETHHIPDGFLCIGCVRLLNDTKHNGEIRTAMAIKFHKTTQAIQYARIWVSLMPTIKRHINIDVMPAPKVLFSSKSYLGKDWQLAFSRNEKGWKKTPSFDLSIFLNYEDRSP